MINLEKKIGPLKLRAWGLIINFIANAVALYGLAIYFNESGSAFTMILGISLTVITILVVSIPSQASDQNE